MQCMMVLPFCLMLVYGTPSMLQSWQEARTSKIITCIQKLDLKII